MLMTTSTLAVLMACSIFYMFTLRHFENSYRSSLENLAKIVGENCKVALAFDIPEDADIILQTFSNQESIETVYLYDQEEKLFATYNKGYNSQDIPVDRRNSPVLKEPASLHIEQNIFLEDESYIGKIILHDNTQNILQARKTIIISISAVALLAIFASYFLASFLQNVISQPLGKLTSIANRLAKGDFESIKSFKIKSNDEIGTLASSFFDMSLNLQLSRRELEEHSHTLEKRVIERTQELNTTLDTLRKSQKQLIHSEKMAAIGVFAAGIAHDINNNINFISSIIPSVTKLTQKLAEQNQITASTKTDSGESTDFLVEKINLLLENAEEGVRRTSKITDDLNTFSRPSSGIFEPVCLHDELDKTLRLLDYEMQGKLTVHKEYSENFPSINCIPDQLNQVFTNILLNALHATKPAGVVTIRTWSENDMIYMRFSDNGCGISPTVLPKLFDPFFTTKKVGEGSGLGLSVSYNIIKNHGGDIQITSKPNEGTQVLLILPIERNDQ